MGLYAYLMLHFLKKQKCANYTLHCMGRLQRFISYYSITNFLSYRHYQSCKWEILFNKLQAIYIFSSSFFMETVQLGFAVSLCVCLNDKIKTALIFYWNVNFDSLTHLTSLTGKIFCVDNFDSFFSLSPLYQGQTDRRVVQLTKYFGLGFWKRLCSRAKVPESEVFRWSRGWSRIWMC